MGDDGLKARVFGLLLLLVSVACGAREPFQHPGGSVTSAQLERARTALAAREAPWTGAFAALEAKLPRILAHEPAPVERFDVPGFYVDPKAHQAAKDRLRADASAAFDCALFQALNPAEGAACAAKATEILTAWATTQREISGHDGDLVMAHVGTMLVQAAELLRGHEAWGPGGEQRFQEWTRRLFRPVSRIQDRSNNWAAWGVFAGLVADHYLDDRCSFERRISRLRRILDDQIDRQGRLPRELGRGGKSLWYSYFALAPLSHAVSLVRNADGIDLRAWKPGSGGSLVDALRFFRAGALDPSVWPGDPESLPIRNGWGANLLFATASWPGQPALSEWVELPLRPTSSAWRRIDLLSPTP